MISNNISSSGPSERGLRPSPTVFSFRLWELTALTVIGFFGACGNSAVILVVCASRKRHGNCNVNTPFNIYLAALAIADLLVTLLGPIWYILLIPEFYPTSIFLGTVQCKFVHFVPCWMVIWSCYMMVVISVERYVAIRFPIWAKVTASPSSAMKVTVVSCVLALVTTIPNVYSGKFVKNGFGTAGDFCTFEWGSVFLQQIV